MKRIYIINGSGGVGKDTFVELVTECASFPVWNYSSVNKVKEIARMIGWSGGKTEKDRRFLSDLKILTTAYNNMPMEDMRKKVKEFHESDAEILFLHIREPEEISRAAEEFHAGTILITRDSVKPITSNMADAFVKNYFYDYYIPNNGTIDDLMNEARQFVEDPIEYLVKRDGY